MTLTEPTENTEVLPFGTDFTGDTVTGFFVALRIQASELFRANNPSEGDASQGEPLPMSAQGYFG